MLRPHWRMLAALALTMPLLMLTVSARGATAVVTPAAPHAGLSGTWRVNRTCTSGCVGSLPVITETVRPFATNVFTATGGLALVLYQIGAQVQIGTQVLVHGAKASSLLMVRTPGQLMSGVSVGADGSTLATTWRCIAPARSVVGAARTTLTTVTATRPAHVSMGAGVC